MDVRKRFHLVMLGLGVMLPGAVSCGCLNPNYAYLTPPGFSSTAHRVKMQQVQQNLLASHEKSGHHHQSTTAAPGGTASSTPVEKGHWWDHWPKGPISIGPAISTKPEAGGGEKSTVAAEPGSPTT